ncbi:hypothetical protein MMC28_010580 [Mycoblastus sanguinarius]|nr:hypothetical protein [Mycoblastus sanguinarius]
MEASLTLQHQSVRLKIIIGITVPVLVLTLPLCLLFLLYRHQKRSSAGVILTEDPNTHESKIHQEPGPFLQQKPELDDEERRRHEMQADEIRNEMEGEASRFEMEGEDDRQEVEAEELGRRVIPSLEMRHELRGEEHAKELEVPK